MSVFDRLTDTRHYTGTAAENFAGARIGDHEDDNDYNIHNEAQFRSNLHAGRTRLGVARRSKSTVAAHHLKQADGLRKSHHFHDQVPIPSPLCRPAAAAATGRRRPSCGWRLVG